MSLGRNNGFSPEAITFRERNEAANEGFEAVPYQVSGRVLAELGEESVSPRVFAVVEYRRFNVNAPVAEAAEFVDEHMVGETDYGYPVWDTSDNAGKFVAGIGSVHSSSTHLRDANAEFTVPTELLSVVWDEDGWCGGGIKPGIKKMRRAISLKSWWDTLIFSW